MSSKGIRMSTLLRGHAELTGGRGIRVGEKNRRPGKIIVATGSSPFAPPIPGLKVSPYLTMVEGMKLASLTFSKDVKQLSCCAA